MTMKRQLTLFITAIVLLGATITATAQIPGQISYQGELADNTGVPLPNGSHSLTFRLYPDVTGGSPVWSEAHATVPVVRGVFNVMLGSQTPFGAAVTFDKG